MVNGDDAGMCHAANQDTIEVLEQGLMRSTVIVPCPWFLEIAAYAKEHPDKDFGIHLCHTSEWKHYRWGPVADGAKVPGLIDPQGYLWGSVEEVYATRHLRGGARGDEGPGSTHAPTPFRPSCFGHRRLQSNSV